MKTYKKFGLEWKKIGKWIICVDTDIGKVRADKYFPNDNLTVVFEWNYAYGPNAKILFDKMKNISNLKNQYQESGVAKSYTYYGKPTYYTFKN